MCPANACRVLTGRHRCAKADLVVVPDLSILHNVDTLAADVDLAVSFLYIASLGFSVATSTQLATVQGAPNILSTQRFVRHVSALRKMYSFCVGPRLKVAQEDMHRALCCIAREHRRSRFQRKNKPTRVRLVLIVSVMLLHGLFVS